MTTASIRKLECIKVREQLKLEILEAQVRLSKLKRKKDERQRECFVNINERLKNRRFTKPCFKFQIEKDRPFTVIKTVYELVRKAKEESNTISKHLGDRYQKQKKVLSTDEPKRSDINDS